MLWVDKYRPQALDALDYHPTITSQLKTMAKEGDFPHLLVYGPSGAGKKTRIMAFLREIYGPGVEKLRVEHRNFKLPSSSTIDLTTVSSVYHIEMNPSDAGYHDRLVIQEVIKSIAQSPPLDGGAQGHASFKVVVLNEADRLSKEAQHALRRTMEKYATSCRLILYCNNPAKILEPIRSRCLGIRVPAPSYEEIRQVLNLVCEKEGLTLPEELSKRIALGSERNLRKAILILEATKVAKYPFDNDQRIEQSDWELYITQVATHMMEEQSPRRLLEVRAKFYELLSHCIPPDIILKKLTLELLKKLDAQLKPEVIKWAAYYEHRLQCGSKPIIHLEAFVAKFMSIYKRFFLSSIGY
ncbi:Subunit of heteropentameric Replication factor C (RF-C) [Balamuthia mandrillaris]